MGYSITSLVRASLVRGPSVVRGFEWQNFSSQQVQRFLRAGLKSDDLNENI